MRELLTKSIHTKKQKELCADLRAAREKLGLTQSQVSKRLGTYKNFVNKYENGDRRLDVIEFVAIVKVLGLDGCELLSKVAE